MKNTKLLVLAAAVGLFQISCDQFSSSGTNTNSNGDSSVELEAYSSGISNPRYPSGVDLESGVYRGSIDIVEGEFKSVYSSQNYGTFYQIYCQPTLHSVDNEQYIKSLEFRIINYKGPMNLGFAKDKAAPHKWNFEEGILYFKIAVQGMSPRNTMVLNIEDLKVKKGELSEMFIYRELIPLAGTGATRSMALSQSGVFDQEFYSRSGLGTTLEKRRVPGQYGFVEDSLPPSFAPQAYAFESIVAELLADPKGNLEIFGESRNCYSSLLNVNW